MPRRCAVPYCRGRSRIEDKCSIFRVPKDSSRRKKWEEAIPGITELRSIDIICERHFDEKEISREWINRDANGIIIAQVPFKYPQLNKDAVPTKFCDVLTGNENCGPLHDYSKRIPISRTCSNKSKSGDQSCKPLSDACQLDIPAETVSSTKPSTKSLRTSPRISEVPATQSTLKKIPISRTSSNKSNNGDQSCKPLSDAGQLDILAETVSSTKPSTKSLLTSPRISEVPATQSGCNSNRIDFSRIIPDSWGVSKLSNTDNQYVFSYTVTKLENGVRCPIAQKCVMLDADRGLSYYVYGRPISQQATALDRILNEKEKLREVLEKFKGMNICNGLGEMNVHLARERGAHQDYVDIWRSKDCSLISKKRRCESCMKLRKSVLQRAARLTNQSAIRRIRNAVIPIDQRKLAALRIRKLRERRQKLRAKERLKFFQELLNWLNRWETLLRKHVAEFRTNETSPGLGVLLHSTMDIYQYIIDKYNFEYLSTGKINQDNLEKFFGTIRQWAGCNDHSNNPIFLQLYKVLSMYSAIKPPKYGNCTVSEDVSLPTIVSLREVKAIYGEKKKIRTKSLPSGKN